MERKVKYNYEFKLRCVEEVLRKPRSVNSVAYENSIASSNLNRWIKFYIEFGNEGLSPRQKNKNYSVNFKLKVLQAIENKSISLSKACLTFNIPRESTITSWQRKYEIEGITGLQLKPKGRPVTMNFKRKKRKTDKTLTREEELLRELEYLRAENEILKKYNALVQAEQANQNKRLKP
ncbi:transposase [Flavobacterium sp. LT1R49]|uniref:transposase n=1 Tax=Flavobacterium arabinosi TaxID=3398737 RepID=UPI003A8B8DB3